MNTQLVLLYDGSFDGFLSTVFHIYDQKIKQPHIRKIQNATNQLFIITEEVSTEKSKATRVWKGLQSKTTKTQQTKIFKAFLSEIKGVENALLRYIQYIFLNTINTKNIDYSNKDILKISQVAQMVGREKHRMEAFVRFQLTKDNIYAATIEPDFNILPLIIHHFKDRYADQKWLIYDLKRNYGIFYDLNKVEIITIDNFSEIDSKSYVANEIDFQKLWNTYYKNVNIKSRKNSKLHLQHIPRRYWKYLIEKKIYKIKC